MECEMISYSSCPMNGLWPGGRRHRKNSKKNKKVLDKEMILCYHIKVRGANKLVPCKLNNVRQTKHLGQLKWIVQIDVKKSN